MSTGALVSSASICPVLDLVGVVRTRRERDVAVGDARQRGGADRRLSALVERRVVVVDVHRDDGLRGVVQLDVRDRADDPPTRIWLPLTSWPRAVEDRVDLVTARAEHRQRQRRDCSVSAAIAITRATIDPARIGAVRGSFLSPGSKARSFDRRLRAGPTHPPRNRTPSGAPCRLLHPERAPAPPRRNCRTNWLSLLKSSLAGPDSTILLPQDRDVIRHAPRRHDVVGDHAVGPAVLLVDLHDQLTQERGPNWVESESARRRGRCRGRAPARASPRACASRRTARWASCPRHRGPLPGGA